MLLSHTHPFNGPFSGTTQVSRYQKGKNNLDFTGARDSEWQWHQLGCMQVCTSLRTDNHASTPPLMLLSLELNTQLRVFSGYFACVTQMRPTATDVAYSMACACV